MDFTRIIIVCVLFIIALISKGMLDEYRRKKRTILTLKRQWGQIPEEEFSYDKFVSVSSYYHSIKDDKNDVDNITWNDLDMDRIYHMLNHTESAMGEEFLYSVLRKPLFTEETLAERNRLIEFFIQNPDQRLLLQSALKRMGKIKNISVYEYINRTDDIDSKSNAKHWFLSIGLLLSIPFTIWLPAVGGIFLVGFIGKNIITYYNRKAEIEKYFSVFSFILRMLYGIQMIAKIDVPELKEYRDTLQQSLKSFHKFKKGSFVVLSGKDGLGSPVDFILDYTRMLFHIDLIKFNSMLSEIRKNKSVLNDLFYTVGTLDAMIAVASYREFLDGNYCKPQLMNQKGLELNVDNLYHPLLEEPVVNSIHESKSVLLTGSNASGKSTFLKTVAINAILSQTIFTSLSSRYQANYYKIFSSMALKDDIMNSESYFIVEIKSLKRILDCSNDTIPMLCFVDEVLRGTNTLERIASSSQILCNMNKRNALCFAATHDIELTQILEKHYSNYHFQERIEDQQVIFDYILYQGKAVSRNAIKLLGIIGYDQNIIQKATEEANYFSEHNSWRNM